jgi:hypothetical protein
MGAIIHKKVLKFGKDYYVQILKPVRDALSSELGHPLGRIKKNKDGSYTGYFEEEELKAIDKVIDQLWDTKYVETLKNDK